MMDPTAATINGLVRRYPHLSPDFVKSTFEDAYNEKIAALEATGASGKYLPALAIYAARDAVVKIAGQAKKGPD